jgi:hypothetical protein
MTAETIFALMDQFEIVILLVLIFAGYAFRDKVIKWLDRGLGISKLRDETHKEDNNLRRDVVKNRLLLNIHNVPFKAEVIEEDYETYKSLGGNSYMDGVMEEWRGSYRKGLIAKRIGTWDGIDRRNNNRKILDD